MDPHLSILIENKVKAVMECNYFIKQNRHSEEDLDYKIKMKHRYISQIKELVETHPELAHHPILNKIEQDLY